MARPTRPSKGGAPGVWDDYLETVFDDLYSRGTWQSYTPALSTDNTQPNLGTSPTQFGIYAILGGKTCVCNFKITWGTSPSVGTGLYLISLPVAASSTYSAYSKIGTGVVYDNSATGVYVSLFQLYGSDFSHVMLLPHGSGGIATATYPVVPAAGDEYSGTLTYRID